MEKQNLKIDKKQEKQVGITLVALVITVVVMLILAGVAIAAVVDGDGLFSKTRQAAETYENAADKEGYMLENLMGQIDYYIQDNGTGTGDDEEDNPPAGGATIGEIVDKNKTYSGGTTGSYSDPIIPKGFAPVNEGDATWGSSDGYQKGLVIEDGSGNQFVWIPVDGTTVKFERVEWGTGYYEKDECEETVPTEISTSITNNGGFYIARYEAGKPEGVTLATDGSVKPVSQQGATVWNNIAWSDDGTNDDTNPGNGAVTVARSMYPDTPDSEYGAVSTLIYGAQWDTALKFIGAYGGDTTYATNSAGKGNYSGTNGADDIASTNEPAECGAREGFKQKNIYDMAGNVYEWTMEKPIDYSTSRVFSGGNCGSSGSDNPASYRSSDNVVNDYPDVRFSCCALYKVALSPKEKRSN